MGGVEGSSGGSGQQPKKKKMSLADLKEFPPL